MWLPCVPGDDAAIYHQECFTKRSAALSQDFIRVQGDNVAQREDERVDVFYVQVVSAHGVRHGVGRQFLRVVACKATRAQGVKDARVGAHGLL